MRLITRVLAKEASGAEEQVLENWIKADSLNEQQFNELKQIWDQTTAPEMERDTNVAWTQFKLKLDKRKKRNNFYTFLKVAAACILVGGAALFLNNLISNSQLTASTDSHEIKKVVLPDGSVVLLHHLSSISYKKSFAGNTREVQLNGEAYFDVVKNPERPFIITTANAITKVLGTSFNLLAFDSAAEVKCAVTSGKVSVTSTLSKRQVIVVADQTAIINPKGETLRLDQVDSNAIAWKTRKLIFRDAPFQEVIVALEHYFDVQIAIENERMNNCHFTGEYKNKSLAAILEDLCKSLQLNYKQKNGQIFIQGRGC